MKRWIAVCLMSVMMVSLLAGCGSKETSEDKESSGSKNSEAAELVIESWRMDDLVVWEDKILPAYKETHPDVNIKFNGVANTEYGTTLTTKLKGGTAGDIIMVEPYDYRTSLYQEGYLSKLNDIEGLDINNDVYDDFAISAWSTDDGDIFGIPLASCTHGFIYNKTAFDKLNLKAPETIDEFFEVCEAIKKEGYVPLAFGTADDFVNSVYAFSLAAPNFVKGEEGRQGLINGTKKFTDPEFVAAWEFLDQWKPYLPDGYQGIAYADMQNLFISQQALIFPAGSWDVSVFNTMSDGSFEMGAFQVPVQKDGDERFVCNHPDMGLALNDASKNKDAAIEFLKWTTTSEFAELWNNELPGLYTLSKHEVDIKDPLAAEMASWAQTAGCSPRIAYQYLSRGDFNTDAEIIRMTGLMFAGDMTPKQVAEDMQKGLEASYTPMEQ